MDGAQFDRIVRTLAGVRSRRHLLAALGAVVLPRTAPAHANQIEIPACAEAGSVCTLIRGCCSGLVCATSYINTGYGVCVTGEGGMLPVSADIVLPSSEGIEAELAQEVADVAASATTTTDPDADRQARIDAKRAKKDSRRTTRKTTNDTQRTTKDTRRTTRRLNEAPRISLELIQQVPLHGTAPTGQPEMVRVQNHDDVGVVLSRIESMNQPHIVSTLSVTIPAGGAYLLESGKYAPTPAPSTSVATVWTRETVCPVGGGVNLTANQSEGTQTHQFSVLCGATAGYASTEGNNSQKRKRKKEQQRQRHKRRRNARQRRRDQKR